MNIDGITLSFLVRELKETLLGEQIQRVQQIDKHTLMLASSSTHKQRNLVFHVGATPAVYLTEGIQDVTKEPTGLALFLRKHLEGARFSEIKQLYDDRIIAFTIDKLTLGGDISSKVIYMELMGRHSNCIITENGQILESLIHVSPVMSKERHISPKLPYELPPNAERMSVGDFDETTLQEILTTYPQETISKTIRSLFNGFGNALLDEVLFRAGQLSVDSPFTPAIAKNVATALHTVYQQAKESRTLYEYGPKRLLSPLPLQHRGEVLHTYDALSPLLQEEQQRLGGMATFQRQLLDQVKKALKKEEERHKKILQEMKEIQNAELLKWYGDLLMIYAYLPHQYESSITVDNVLQEMEWDVPICKALKELQQEPQVTIPLEPNLTLIENGQRYYKKFQRLKKRAISGQMQLDSSTVKLEYLASLQYSLESEQSKKALQEIQEEAETAGLLKMQKGANRNKKEKPELLTIEIPNGRILVGRNNKQNDYLTHRLASKEDLWFHTLHIQGSHVVLQTEHEPTDEEINLAASYAAYFSKAKDTSKVPVDYTAIKNIKKPPASPLGYVIYEKQKTIMVTPLAPNNA